MFILKDGIGNPVTGFNKDGTVRCAEGGTSPIQWRSLANLVDHLRAQEKLRSNQMGELTVHRVVLQPATLVTEEVS